MSCECLSTMCGVIPQDFGQHHHVKCPLYTTEKNWHVFVRADETMPWQGVVDTEEGVIKLDTSDFNEDEVYGIQLMRLSLTDKEYSELPFSE